MPTQAQNSAELYTGMAEIAGELGSLQQIYRGSTQASPYGDPITATCLIGEVMAAFARNYVFSLPVDPRQPRNYGMFDPRDAKGQPNKVLKGDYLVDKNSRDIYFVGDIPPFSPELTILCNGRVTLYRAQDADDGDKGNAGRIGSIGDFGNVSVGDGANEAVILRDWPASILFSGRGERNPSGVPTVNTSGQFNILLPVLPVQIDETCLVQDDTGRRFTLIAVQRDTTGYRLIGNQAEV